MMKRACVLTVMLSLLVLISSCATAPYPGPVEISGAWKYALTDTNQNTYDAGTIRFEGQKVSGSWTLRNTYDIEYRGTWQLDGTSLALAGDETWQGRATGPDSIEGTWRNESGDSGTWIARRQ